MLSIINEKRWSFDSVFLSGLVEEHFVEGVGKSRKQPEVTQSVHLRIRGGVQPELPAVDENHLKITLSLYLSKYGMESKGGIILCSVRR